MTKLDDVVIRTPDRGLREFILDIVTLWNSGKIDFKVTASVPNDTPSGAEMRLFDSGGGAVRIYIYSPDSEKWYATANLSSV